MLRAAIFDMDGLLVDSEPVWQDAEIEVFGTLGVHLTREDCWQTKGQRVDATIAYWFARRPWAGPPQDEVARHLVRRVIEPIRERARAKEGARHALDVFRSSGLRLALASSSAPELIAAVLHTLRMRSDFEAVHSAVNEPEGKPHPAVYLSTARSLGVDPRECVALEDSLIGVAAARAAGMLCIAVPDAGSGPPGQESAFGDPHSGANLTLRSLLEIDASVIHRLASLDGSSPNAAAAQSGGS